MSARRRVGGHAKLEQPVEGGRAVPCAARRRPGSRRMFNPPRRPRPSRGDADALRLRHGTPNEAEGGGERGERGQPPEALTGIVVTRPRQRAGGRLGPDGARRAARARSSRMGRATGRWLLDAERRAACPRDAGRAGGGHDKGRAMPSTAVSPAPWPRGRGWTRCLCASPRPVAALSVTLARHGGVHARAGPRVEALLAR